jgi:citrate synthase
MRSALNARQVVQSFIAARFADEPDRALVASFLTEDFQYVVPRSFGVPLNRDAALEALVGLNNALFDPATVQYHEKSMLADADHVVVEHSVTATTVDGRAYENDFCWVYELVGGKIARAVQYADTLQARRCLGDSQDAVFGDLTADAPPPPGVGLDGVLACTTSVCSIDGEQGDLRYRGYEIRDLVGRRSFADVAQLLWLGRWPTPAERELFDAGSRARLELPAVTQAVLDALPDSTHPLAALCTALSIDGALDEAGQDRSAEAVHDKALTVYARTATLVGALACRARGEQPRPPRPDLSRGPSLLWMAVGIESAPVAVEALDALLVTYAEHELNPSTFAGRVVAGTHSDYWSAVIGAIGAFKGPMHGGVFGEALQVLQQLGSPAAARAYALDALERQAQVPGFWAHHVYRTHDPRVGGMRRHAGLLSQATGQDELFETARELERVLAEGSALEPSADYYGALVMHLLGFPRQVFSSLLVAGRFAGWTAHICEQYAGNAPLRPRAAYVGHGPRVLEHPGPGA